MADAYHDANRVPTLIGVSSIDGETPVRVTVNPVTDAMVVEGDVIVNNALITVPFDSIAVTYPTTSIEVYTYKLGVTTVGIVTVTYSDAVTKDIITSVVLT